MIKRILKWTGIIVGLVVLLLAVTVSLRQNLKYDAPFPDIKASADSSVIARGKYLALGPAHCADCHASPGSSHLVEKGIEVPLSGGNKFDLNTWNNDYFTRLKNFVTYAASKNIIIEFTLFSVFYGDEQLNLSPIQSANNINGIGA